MSNSTNNATHTLPVVGHRAPDTDAVASALVYAHLLGQLGTPATAYRLGELNNETAFVLRRLSLDTPELLQTLPAETAVALVDHNESAQSLENLNDLQVTHVIDHHKLGDLSTSAPAYIRLEPVGCTATILFKLFGEHKIPVAPQEALLMLSAILSDTLHFRSPTTTDADRVAVEHLAALAEVTDIEAYALELFSAKSDLGDIAPDKLLKMDYKEFTFSEDGTLKWGIGVIETTNPAYVFGRKAELIEAMQVAKQNDSLDGILLSVVDILQETNTTFIIGDTEAQAIKAAFSADTQDHCADLGQRVSRKKQLIPALQQHFNNNQQNQNSQHIETKA